jgi:hypothetical protein
MLGLAGTLPSFLLGRLLIRLVSFLLAAAICSAAAAQSTSPPPVTGPAPVQARRDLWQVLTPEQREQLWRSLSAEQRADVWRGLEPQERREMRDRLGPAELNGNGRGYDPRQLADSADGAPKRMMTPEERLKMREQIREAHRMRRERMEDERRTRVQ